MVALDSAIIQHPRTWEASGHLAGFTDPLIDCRTCKQRFRADHLEEERSGSAQPPGGPLRQGALEAARRPSRLRPDRGARVQPDVRDHDRAGQGRRLDRLPAARDRAGDLPRLQDDASVRASQAALRDRPDRQVVPQRDHAGQLHLPHARVRADGDGVLRPAGRGRELARALDAGAHGLVRRPRARPRAPAPARARRRTSCRTTRRPPATSSTSIRSAGPSSRASPTAATSTSPSTRSSPARSSSTSTPPPRSATSRT